LSILANSDRRYRLPENFISIIPAQSVRRRRIACAGVTAFLTFYEFIKSDEFVKSIRSGHCERSAAILLL
jgi:hypothetical protein